MKIKKTRVLGNISRGNNASILLVIIIGIVVHSLGYNAGKQNGSDEIKEKIGEVTDLEELEDELV